MNQKSLMDLAAAGALLVGLATTAMPASAKYTMDLNEVGSDVVATGSGSFDLTALTGSVAPGLSGGATIWSKFPMGPRTLVQIGTTDSVAVKTYTGFTGPTLFGSVGTSFSANSGSGDVVGIMGGMQIQLSSDYVSGSALSSTSTWLNQDFTSLGLDTGTYTWTWGSGSTADSLVLNVGVAPVPEPETYAMLLAGLGVLGGVARRHKRESLKR